ncbi:MAG: hypothetical protein ABJN34_16615 [Litoreibacter sp.]|uniref:hypothetical protein n=1 Tax=Litoreibacter sp. TaxID=1969459 RepID=UPI0032976114
MLRTTLIKSLLSTSILAAGGLSPTLTFADTDREKCLPQPSGHLISECFQDNAGAVIAIPTAPNTEQDTTRPAVNNAGFSISLDGDTIDSDPTIEDQVRKVDLALEEANVQITFDGLTAKPRLGVETVGEDRGYSAGERVTLQSETNYPAFIERGEFRIFDREAIGGPRLAAVVPVEANGRASVILPEGKDLVVVHRVYGARGRYDETAALPLGQADDCGLSDDVEELDNGAVVRNIKVTGGAVTVYADNLAADSTVSTLGSSARPDASGALVLQRILPPGEHDVSVRISGPQTATITRPLEVPGSEWFYVVVGDVTIERVEENDVKDTRTLGRFQYYVDGRTANGVEITSSLDTGEEELRDIFRRLDEKDPRSVLERIDPEDTYPTFGDDSEIYDNTPTSGKFYLKVQKNENSFVWGDYQATLSGNTFIRNERTLYGAQVELQSEQTTENGDPRLSAEFFAAQPDQLAGRETFQGTDGAVYFLRRQDITQGTETITVEIRDAVTGLVIDQQRLTVGTDYYVNYLQGVITLTSPLTDSVNDNLIQTNPGGDQTVNLVVAYEYTPTTSDVDGYSFGGRVEGWVTDEVRLGFSATKDDTGAADHRTYGIDVRYQFSENSYVQFDAAHSEGPGLVQDFSIDGGLTIDGQTQATGEGDAYRLAGQADLRDLGYDRDGVVGGYIEHREEGFSSLDYSVTATTGDELFYGVYARVAKTETQLGWAVYADIYDNDAGVERTEVGFEIEGNINPQLSYVVGAEYLDERTATTNGSRFDVAGRVEWVASPKLTYYAFGQAAADSDNLDEYNRLGVGFSRQISDKWRLEAEVSEGTGGLGGRVLANYDAGNGNSRYFGYELDAGRTVEAAGTLGSNRGRYLIGGRQQINDSLSLFAENSYDLFSSRRTLTSAYGLEYKATEFLTYDGAIEYGQVAGTAVDDLDRFAISLGVRYDSEDLTAQGRIEYRQDDAAVGSSFNDFDAIYFSSNLRYKIDEERRFVFSLDLADVSTDGSSVLDGSIVDLEMGYAYRPIWDERLNVLARYRYLRDMFGQEIDGVAGVGARQESHVFSLEGSYDLSRSWTLGGKVGGRFTESSASSADPFGSNDAWLAVVNARYHLVHEWDLLLEGRHLDLVDAGLSETSFLGAAYKHVGNNLKIGAGYNFGTFSDDLTDLTRDDQGAFINIIAKF